MFDIALRIIQKFNIYALDIYRSSKNFEKTTLNKSNQLPEQNYYSYIFVDIFINFNAVFACKLRILIYENYPLKRSSCCIERVAVIDNLAHRNVFAGRK